MQAQILVIEDNETNLDLMVYLLRAFGYSAIVARDGAEGLEAARGTRPDLVICDLVMPRVDGYEVGRRLKSSPEYRAIPLIAVTALAMVGEREKALAAGFDGYIPKPIDPETFVSQVEQYLRPGEVAGHEPERHAAGQENQLRPEPVLRATILVVDDSPANLQLLRSILEPFGYSVLSCSGPTVAREVLDRNRVDLVLCDLHMPNQNGFEFAQALRADPRLSSIPLMLMSSSSSGMRPSADLLAAARLRFIKRPFDPQELVDEIEACLNRRGQAERPAQPEAKEHGPDSRR